MVHFCALLSCSRGLLPFDGVTDTELISFLAGTSSIVERLGEPPALLTTGLSATVYRRCLDRDAAARPDFGEIAIELAQCMAPGSGPVPKTAAGLAQP